MGTIFGLVCATGLVLFVMSPRGSFGYLVSLEAIWVTLIIPLFAALAAFGFTDLRKTLRFLLRGPDHSNVMTKRDLYRLRSLRNFYRSAGCIAILVGAIMICQNNAEPWSLGPAIALSTLGVFYALLVAELLIGTRCMQVDRLLGGRVSVGQPSVRPAVEAFAVFVFISILLLVMYLSVVGHKLAAHVVDLMHDAPVPILLGVEEVLDFWEVVI